MEKEMLCVLTAMSRLKVLFKFIQKKSTKIIDNQA